MNWRRFLESASRPVLELGSRTALDLALVALLVAVVWPAAAFADGAAVKCAPNEERVWLYDSVTSLNVETKLKCGESVEVIGQQSGYMKVRTANGTEGYLPESNLPKPAASAETSGAQPIPGAPPTLASLARAAAARRAAAAPAAAPIATPSNASVAPPAGAVNASPAMQPKTVAAVAAAPSSASTTTSAPTSAAVSATPVSSTVSSTGATPAAAIPATAHPATAAAAHAKPKAAAKATTSTTVTTSAKAPSNVPGSSNPPAASAPRTSTSAPLHVAAATPAPKAPSAQPAAVVATDIYVGGPADVYVGGASNNGSAPKAAANAPKVRTVAATSDDDDDSYLTRPKNESEDPSCQTYFSGYGLSPGQFKWLEDNRVKKYPSVCPAASPAMVDYVIIFTHDVDFFNYTMPAPVHYEAGGFSDWTPILQYDTSVVSHSDIDKSKREYVWVFHVKRGAFDPNKFSPHRRFQYTKSESKYSRTVEDAFEFIGGQGGER
jgi:uncharacterized protein YgiM (DUF1202 family)